MATNEEVLTPKVLIVPSCGNPTTTMPTAAIGTLVMSGATLAICTVVGTFKVITST